MKLKSIIASLYNRHRISGKDSDFFFKKFTIVAIQCLFFIAFLTFFLAYREMVAERQKSTTRILNELHERSLFLNSRLENLRKQVSVMQNEANNHYLYFDYLKYDDQSPYPKLKLLDFVFQDSLGYSLDLLPDTLKERIGNLSGIGDMKIKIKQPDFYREVSMQFPLGNLYSSILKQYPEVAWLFTISRNDFAFIYPFVPSYAARYDSSYHQYDIYKLGLPEYNSKREMFITPVYQDAGGKGLMVSIGAPVYEGNTFKSIVGLDLTLKFLTDFAKQNSKDGELIIINEKNQLLAHPTLIHELDTVVRHLDEPLGGLDLKILKSGNFTEWHGKHIFTEELTSVPWKILYVTPKQQLTLNTIIGKYYFVLLGLLLSILFLIFYTYKNFIKPSHQLVRYIESYNQTNTNMPKGVHPGWLKWFKISSQAFEKKLQVINHLDSELQRKNIALLSNNHKLEMQREQLIREHAAKDKIFSIVSHDLKAPISTLVGILNLLRQNYITDQELKILLPDIENKTKRIKLMLDNLLQWSIYNLRGDKLMIESVNLNLAVNDSLELLDSLAKAKSLKLVFKPSQVVHVRTDRNVLDLVLRNLIYNAIKFSYPEGEITIIVESDAEYTSISVIDRGQGIAEDIKEQIFVLGISGASKTTGEKGTGLGLALCKEFLAKVGGTIECSSQEQKGSVFVFQLPTAVPVNVNAFYN